MVLGLAVMALGCAGVAFTVTVSVRAVPMLPQAVGSTLRATALATPAVVVTVLVPCPAVTVHPKGTVQL